MASVGRQTNVTQEREVLKTPFSFPQMRALFSLDSAGCKKNNNQTEQKEKETKKKECE